MKSFKQCQDKEKVIQDMLSKNKEILEFRDNFMRIEQEINDSIIYLFKKVQALRYNQQQGQIDINIRISQQDKRLNILERDQTIFKQELGSHKLLKMRQITSVEEKTLEMRDFDQYL